MKANVQKKKITGNGFLLLITIALFVVMYVAGMIVFADKGFAKPQMFLNLFVSNAGLLVIACGLTIVMITGGIDISVGSVTAKNGVKQISDFILQSSSYRPYEAQAHTVRFVSFSICYPDISQTH